MPSQPCSCTPVHQIKGEQTGFSHALVCICVILAHTGHGVGAALNVHEGPQSISSRYTITTPLVAGMVRTHARTHTHTHTLLTALLHARLETQPYVLLAGLSLCA